MKEIRIVDARQSKEPTRAKAFIMTALFFAALFGPGVLADSAAMQWAGFVVLLVMIFLMMVAWNAKKMTIEEAREELNKLEAK